MAEGQIAMNYAATTPAMFIKDSAGQAVKVGPTHVGAVAPNATPAGGAGNSLGESWLDVSGAEPILKIWDGSQWLASSSGGATVATGDVAPANPQEGDLWWDSVSTTLYVWYADIDSAQWVQASPGGGGGGVSADAGNISTLGSDGLIYTKEPVFGQRTYIASKAGLCADSQLGHPSGSNAGTIFAQTDATPTGFTAGVFFVHGVQNTGDLDSLFKVGISVFCVTDNAYVAVDFVFLQKKNTQAGIVERYPFSAQTTMVLDPAKTYRLCGWTAKNAATGIATPCEGSIRFIAIK
jgi:hypothetical protein